MRAWSHKEREYSYPITSIDVLETVHVSYQRLKRDKTGLKEMNLRQELGASFVPLYCSD